MSVSPILSIEHGDAPGVEQRRSHSHPEPVLLSTSTATVLGAIADRDWLVPPGYRVAGWCSAL